MTQLYLSFKPTDNVAHEESYLNDIVAWMHDNMLKLNTDKTELIVFASQRNFKFVENVLLTISESNSKSASCVKDIGASFDSKLFMEKLTQSADPALHSYCYCKSIISENT